MKHIPRNCRTSEVSDVLKLQKDFVEDSDRRSLRKKQSLTKCSLCLFQIYKEPSEDISQQTQLSLRQMIFFFHIQSPASTLRLKGYVSCSGPRDLRYCVRLDKVTFGKGTKMWILWKKKRSVNQTWDQNPVSWLMCVSFDSTKSSSSLFTPSCWRLH